MSHPDLREWGPFPFHLENPNGRQIRTAAELLKFHGYTGLAEDLMRMANDLLKVPPTSKTENIRAVAQW